MSEEGAPVSRERTVIVAEDESLIRMDVIETLKDNGFTVVGEAGDGEKAVELAREHQPDVVVMDVKMPLLDGISAAEILSKEKICPSFMASSGAKSEPKTCCNTPPEIFPAHPVHNI